MLSSLAHSLLCLHHLKRNLLTLLCLSMLSMAAEAELRVVIIEGLGGEPAYQKQFDKEATAIQVASASITRAEQVSRLTGAAATRANIMAVMKKCASSLNKEDRLALYLIGHGSYDGYTYKFNLPGADITGAELVSMLNAVKADNQLIVVTGSASGALQVLLKKDSRIVVTATRNGNERNITQFGQYFADALMDANADSDKNGRISVQEALDMTARKVKDYYEAESRLATEHPQLTGLHAGVFNISELPGEHTSVTTANASLLAQREQLTGQIDELRLRKESLAEDMYLQQLEVLLLQLAELDARIDTQSGQATTEAAP